jgi:hypothetical protein
MAKNWTQPVCTTCWDDEHPFRHPVRIANPDTETCCYCGTPTTSGIYVRVDPDTVPHPTNDEEPSHAE